MKGRIAVLATFLAASASLAAGQQDQMDMDVYMKWAKAELIHYDVVAEYSAQTPVLEGYKTAVKDRFELSFDYIPVKVSITGKPVFKNATSTVSSASEGAVCLQLEALGPYEHLDILEVKPGFAALELRIRRTFPAGRIPGRSDTTGKCGFTTSAAKVETMTHAIPAIPGTVFGDPSLAPKSVLIGESASQTNTVTVGKDEKTIVVVDEKGWKYTYSLRIAK